MKHGITAAALAAAAMSTQASTVWDEVVNGDLSGNRLAPTAVSTAIGHNAVFGTTGNNGSGVDRDYFHFTVPTGAVLSQLVVLPLTGVSGSSSFIAIQAGTQITVTPSGGGNVGDLYGLYHYENADAGADILPKLVSIPAGLPVPAGSYSVWVQETGGQVSYGLDFVITAVPEPAAALSLSLGLLGLACRRSVLQRR